MDRTFSDGFLLSTVLATRIVNKSPIRVQTVRTKDGLIYILASLLCGQPVRWHNKHLIVNKI